MSKGQTEAGISTWREVPPYNAKARNDHAEAHCRTWQHGRHIDTLPREPKHYQKIWWLKFYHQTFCSRRYQKFPLVPPQAAGSPLTMDELARLMRLYAEIDDD